MTYQIGRHPNLPVLIATWSESFVFSRDGKTYSDDMRNHLNQLNSPAYYLLDLRAVHDMTFEELRTAASMAARGPDANFHHKMNLGTLFVTSDPAIKATAEGLQADIYGNAKTIVFTSLDDALNYVVEHRE